MLAAPVINGTLPAFYSENGIATIAIPFSMNRGVNQNDIKGFSLKLKNVQGSSYLLTKESSKIDYNENIAYFELTEEEMTNRFFIGLFYKAQLAYIDKVEVGYYSTVGVLKYTTKPDVSILNMKTSVNNGHIYNYTGTYSQKDRDTTEKVYSYRFIVSDMDNNIVEDTAWLIHNNSNDENQYESQDSFQFDRDLLEGEKFKIKYMIRTNNNLEISSPDYRIIAKKTIQSNLMNTKINAKLNVENAYIDISLEGARDQYGLEIPVSGYYILSRAGEDTNYTHWDIIDKFTLAGVRPSKKSWKDFTIEQGKNYKYSIQQYNDKGLFSERVYSEVIHSDFEHIYLYDGTRQLKIKYNPKVSSFKIDRLEAKVDTLGSKYPFIFRNGNVEYKEFPISGLISYHSDEEGLFLFKNLELFKNEERIEIDGYTRCYTYDDYLMALQQEKQIYIFFDKQCYTLDEGYKYIQIYPNQLDDKKPYGKKCKYENPNYGIYDVEKGTYIGTKTNEFFNFMDDFIGGVFYHTGKQRHTDNKIKDIDKYKKAHFNLTSDNQYLEREFKLEALEWLSNGKPKLFKSPVEGSYLVRLMNVGLSPIDTLNRMVHTFNSTAYEVSDNNYNALIEHGIIDLTDEKDMLYTKYMTIPLVSSDINFNNLHPNYKAINGNVIKYATGEIVPDGITLNTFTIEDMIPGTKIIVDGQEIIIGSTGTYSSPIQVQSIIIPMKKIEINNEGEYYHQNLYDDSGNLIKESYCKKSDQYIENKNYYIITENGNYIKNKNVVDEETYNLEKNGKKFLYRLENPEVLENITEYLADQYDPYYSTYFIRNDSEKLITIEINTEEEFETIKAKNNNLIYYPYFAPVTNEEPYETLIGDKWYFYKESINKYIQDQLVSQTINPNEYFKFINGQDLYESADGVYYVPQPISGSFNVVYKAKVKNTFNNIVNANTYDIYGHQFIGEHEDIIKEVEDVATKILNVYDIKFYQRPLEEYYIEEMFELMEDGFVNEENYFDYYIKTIDGTFEPAATLPEYWHFYGYYYKRIVKYISKVSKRVIIEYDSYFMSGDKITINEEGKPSFTGMNSMVGYYKEINQEHQNQFGLPMMKLVNFKYVDNSEIYNRDLKERSASNSMIMDIIRDYPLLVESQKLYWFDRFAEPAHTRSLKLVSARKNEDGTLRDKYDSNKTYCMLIPYHEIITLENLDKENQVFIKNYIPLNEYNDFAEFLDAFNPDFKESLPEPWNDKVYINGNSIKISDSKYFNTGNIGFVNSIKTTSGVYCEFYYQKQEIDYDIEKNYELQQLKIQLDDYKRILSSEYMKEKCKTAEGEQEYIIEKNEVINGAEGKMSYNDLYNKYISYLNRYLIQLNKGV